MVIMDRLHLLTMIFPVTLTGQIRYVKKDSGVLYGPTDWGRIGMSTSARKISPSCVPVAPAGSLLSPYLLRHAHLSNLSQGPS